MSKLVEKIKQTPLVSNYRRMWPYVKPYWARAVIAMVVTIPVGMMDAVIAWSLKPYMDVMMLKEPAKYTAYIPLIIIVFSLLQGMLNYAATYLNTWVGRRLANDVKMVLFKKLMTSDAQYFDMATSGEVQFRYNNDVDMACNGLVANIKLFTTRIVSSLSLIVVLFINSWHLAIVAVIVMFGALYPLTTVRKKLKELMDKSVTSGAAVSTHYNETFHGNRIISSYNLDDYQSQRFNDTLRTVFRLGMKTIQRTGMISPMMHFIVSIGIALVIWGGSHMIATEQITPGNFVSFITALIMLYTPIKAIGNNYNSVQKSFLAMERVWTLMDNMPMIQNKENAIHLQDVKKNIRYQNVFFEYIAGKPVLKNINLDVSVGQTIALVGNSGGGKSTFSNLLPRFYDVKSGSITIDNVDVRDFDLKSLREKIAIVFQDNFLFSGTIRDNIILDYTDAPNEKVTKAVKDACLEEFVTSLEKGLDTEIGERGVLLSGGQKQRIAIARAFLKDAPIVILDEATSALDNKSEAVVQEAIGNLMKNRTVFIIAHRLSTVRQADKIVVLNHGEIAETGTHDELLAKEGSVYASLYETQLT